MISNYVVDGINQFMKGDNSPSVNGDDILNWLYPIPPLDEQKQIVIKTNEVFEQVNFIEKNKTDLQTAIKQAKSKILDLAIHGKLVPQDSSDEPVSVLLEKIRAEKEAKIKAVNSRKIRMTHTFTKTLLIIKNYKNILTGKSNFFTMIEWQSLKISV